MLSNISNAELAKLAKKMRATARMSKESLKQKRKAPVTITQPRPSRMRRPPLGSSSKEKGNCSSPY